MLGMTKLLLLLVLYLLTENASGLNPECPDCKSVVGKIVTALSDGSIFQDSEDPDAPNPGDSYGLVVLKDLLCGELPKEPDTEIQKCHNSMDAYWVAFWDALYEDVDSSLTATCHFIAPNEATCAHFDTDGWPSGDLPPDDGCATCIERVNAFGSEMVKPEANWPLNGVLRFLISDVCPSLENEELIRCPVFVSTLFKQGWDAALNVLTDNDIAEKLCLQAFEMCKEET